MAKDLYEIAAAFGPVAPFQLYNLLPRCLIPHNGAVSELPFSPPSVLVAEELDDAPDPLEFLAESETAKVHGSSGGHYVLASGGSRQSRSLNC